MFLLNKKMDRLYRELSLDGVVLNEELKSISNSGFEKVDGCFFISSLWKIDTNVTLKDFPDLTGYECFINSVNVDDYVEDGFLEQGLLFLREVFSLWVSKHEEHDLKAILTSNEFGLKVKFHVERCDEVWLSDDLDSYDESVMVVNSKVNWRNIGSFPRSRVGMQISLSTSSTKIAKKR